MAAKPLATAVGMRPQPRRKDDALSKIIANGFGNICGFKVQPIYGRSLGLGTA